MDGSVTEGGGGGGGGSPGGVTSRAKGRHLGLPWGKKEGGGETGGWGGRRQRRGAARGPGVTDVQRKVSGVCGGGGGGGGRGGYVTLKEPNTKRKKEICENE